jgi:hypothetical protein
VTENPESPSESAAATAADRSAETAGWKRPSRLSQAAAVVGIVAGLVFIIGAVFFSGFFLGSRLEHHSGPQVMRCEMGGSGEGKGGMGGMSPGGMGGMGPGGMGPMGPSQPPSSTSTAPPAPSTPRP